MSVGNPDLLPQSPPPTEREEPSVTLAEAIRLSERVQPDVVRAPTAAIRTAGAQRKNASLSSLPTISASSSANDFFSEGAVRVEPRSPASSPVATPATVASLPPSGNLDLFTGFRRGGAAGRAGRGGGGGCLTHRCPLSAGPEHHEPVPRRPRRSPTGRGPREQRPAGGRAAENRGRQVRAGSATRSDSLRSLVTLENAPPCTRSPLDPNWRRRRQAWHD